MIKSERLIIEQVDVENKKIFLMKLKHNLDQIGQITIMDNGEIRYECNLKKEGYSTEAMKAIKQHILEDGEIYTLYIKENNEPSLNFANKLGFQYTGLSSSEDNDYLKFEYISHNKK